MSGNGSSIGYTTTKEKIICCFFWFSTFNFGTALLQNGWEMLAE
jgi:dolichyl-phosphate-mannose--protein O-mannosyl transferase